MKKISFFLITCMLFALSCEKNDQNSLDSNDIQSFVLSMELEVYSGNLKDISPSRDIINTDFFDKMTLFKNAKSSTDIEKASLTLGLNRAKDYELDLTFEEEQIYKSFFSIMEERLIDEKLAICDLFMAELEVVHLHRNIKDKIIYTISGYRDLIVFLNSENKIDTSNSKGAEWDCPYRSCFDCCMTSKLQDVEDGNWIDKALFMSAFYINIPAMGASCAWDCAFQ